MPAAQGHKSIDLETLMRMAAEARQDAEKRSACIGRASVDDTCRYFVSGLIGRVSARFGDDAGDDLALALGMRYLIATPELQQAAIGRAAAKAAGVAQQTEAAAGA